MIEITQMSINDIDEVCNMFIELYEHLNSKGFAMKLNTVTVNELIEALVDSNFGKIFVASSGEGVLGFINVNITKVNIKFKSESKYTGNITELFVKKQSRGSNAGKLLVAEAKKYLKKQGVEYIQVNTMVKNKDAIQFYKNIGFKEDYISFFDTI